MLSNREDLLRAFYVARKLGDHDCALAYLADDVEVTVHAPADTIPFAGHTFGRQEVELILRELDRTWDIIEIGPLALSVAGDHVWGMLQVRMRHRRTREVLEKRVRTYWAFNRRGRICRIEQFVDQPLLEAYMRLAMGYAWPQAA